jgi:hypothetical protein
VSLKRVSRLTLLTAGIVLGAVAIPSSALASFTCRFSKAESKHCYAEAEWNEANLGVSSQIRTFFASVPKPSSQFVNMEMWDAFSSSEGSTTGWVEAGDKAGYGAGIGGPVGFDYFTAVDYPPGSPTEGYYESDFTYGPEADMWFEDTLHAAGYGVWYIYIAGSHVWSWGSLPGAAAWAADGMESTNNKIVASGQSTDLSYWSSSNGASYSGWPGDLPVQYGHTCISLSGDTSESFTNELEGC